MANGHIPMSQERLKEQRIVSQLTSRSDIRKCELKRLLPFSLSFLQNVNQIKIQFYMQEQLPSCHLNIYHQQQENINFLKNVKLLTLSPQFKFIQSVQINHQSNIFVVQGRLIYNNGSVVPISPGHMYFLYQHLNPNIQSGQRKITFNVDQGSQALIYTAKSMYISDENIDQFRLECDAEVLEIRHKLFIALAIIGFPLDSQNVIMRKILLEKKKLNHKIREILLQQFVHNQMDIEDNNSQNGGVFELKKNGQYFLSEKNKNQEEKKKMLQGGYFNVEDTNYQIRQKSGKIFVKSIVLKQLREKRKIQDIQRQTKHYLKMERQIQTIQKITNKKYLIKYFIERNAEGITDKIYMERYDQSLQDYIHYLGQTIQYHHRISIARQVIDAVLTIHNSEVVHRDIKPANFLIDDSNKDGIRVKIIDFAQSYEKEHNFNIDYAYSHPYSPIQCIEKKIEGINRKQIDYWSVAMTIYQIFFRKLPVSFSRAFIVDITSNWRSQLLLLVNQREKFGFNLIEDIVSILCIKALKIQQKERLNIIIAKNILKALEEYLSNLIQFIKECK